MSKKISVKNQYEILELISKKSIILIHVRCIYVNLLILLKWLFQFGKSYIYNSKKYSGSGDPNSVQHNSDHQSESDRQPALLMETTLGRHAYVKLKKIKLHYVEAGNKSNPVVLLLHGFADCWLGWRHQIPVLSQYFHVIALDLKGFNDSSKPQWRYDYTPKKICEEIKNFIYSLETRNVILIGHDLGAVIGWLFAHIHPELVEKFICISAPHPNLIWSEIPKNSDLNEKWLHFVQCPLLPEMELKHTNEKLLRKFYSHVLKEKNYFNNGNNGSADNQILGVYKYIFSQTDDWTGPLNYFRNFIFYRIKEGKSITCPCLIITGNEDSFYKLESVVKSSDYCENFLIKIIEGAGHWPHQDTYDVLNNTILKFLIGKRIIQQQEVEKPISRGIVGRMFGVVSNGVKLGKNSLDATVGHYQNPNNIVRNTL